MKKYIITNSLPRSIDGAIVLNDGKAIYEVNYFCGLLRDKATGIFFVDWDTDITYVKFFDSREAAQKMADSITVDGCKVECKDFPSKEPINKIIFLEPNKN